MNLADCYRLLGLSSGASFQDIKASYRLLARRYHPDVSVGDQAAKDKFIEVTAAYKHLLNALTNSTSENSLDERATSHRSGSTTRRTATAQASTTQTTPGKTKRKAVQIQANPNLSPLEYQLKVSSYKQLQALLKEQRFPRAIALVEGLARRLPQDFEITQWQAIVYQQWGRQLICDRQPDKARIYLKKALQTDPYNRSLWAEVEKDFRKIEQGL